MFKVKIKDTVTTSQNICRRPPMPIFDFNKVVCIFDFAYYFRLLLQT